MAPLNRDQLEQAMVEKFSAEPDESGQADLVCSKGYLGIAADRTQIKPAVKRLRSIHGYRFLVINRGDLFAANPATIGSKIGILDENGSLLKAADLPRRR
ncbi:MAG: hypothetical protein F4Y75_00195 [Acidimicrobiia bacterium]|nr:hypothetical protein [Acidimicrobiia bacterium]MYD03918.1 hypothetical protein [Acidimicrobiia bacterium]MYF26630.1 hypothetical protein [Acidimicrobiia bacterium]MYH56294.1 hypothetical protein [Acidimicrobiia bacterium]